MNEQIRLAKIDDIAKLTEVGAKLFDNALIESRAIEFFNEDHNLMSIAIYNESVVGFASGFIYVHPDKEPSLFINEVGVLETHQNRGIARRLVYYLTKEATNLGCRNAWVATESSNAPARKAFIAAGGIETSNTVVLIEYKN